MQPHSISYGAASPRHRHSLTSRARILLQHVGKIVQIARERRELAALDDRMLKDLGLSRSVAHREAERSWLDVPGNRRHHE